MSTEAKTWQEQGERLSYNIHYLGLEAGEAEILFEPNFVENQGKNSQKPTKYRIVARAWTNGLLGSLVTLKDRLTVIGGHNNYSGKFVPDTYSLRLHENDYSANKKVVYSREDLAAYYYNLKEDNGFTEYQINWHMRDMISALYYLRDKLVKVEIGNSYQVPIFDLNSHYKLHLNVIGREKMRTKLGKINVLHIQPVLEGIKDRNKDDKWHLWITDDAERIPVKIKVKMKFGSFTATLRNVNIAKSGSRVPQDLPLEGDFSNNNKPLEVQTASNSNNKKSNNSKYEDNGFNF